jgi:hypothetical protein
MTGPAKDAIAGTDNCTEAHRSELSAASVAASPIHLANELRLNSMLQDEQALKRSITRRDFVGKAAIRGFGAAITTGGPGYVVHGRECRRCRRAACR